MAVSLTEGMGDLFWSAMKENALHNMREHDDLGAADRQWAAITNDGYDINPYVHLDWGPPNTRKRVRR